MIDFKAIIAGLLIGLGVIINLQMQTPLIGAIMFSFGLLTIIHLQCNLFTGQVGFLKPHLLRTLLWNLVGIAATIYMYTICNPKFQDILTKAAEQKFEKPCVAMLFYGIFCGFLIHFAVKMKQDLLTIMAIVMFILIGAEHCVADFPFLLVNWSFDNFMKFLAVIVGNSLGAIVIEKGFEYE